MDVSVLRDLRKTCRTCLRVHESRKELISVFDSDQTFPSKNVRYSEMLTAVADHPVYEHDSFPKRICVVCLQSIRSSFYFRSQAEKSYKSLLKQLESCNLIPAGSIKQEHAKANLEISSTEEYERNADHMLIEVEEPRLQNTNGYIEDSDEQEIIDYEPEYSDEVDEIPENGTSPDSGIIRSSSPENNSSSNSFYEQQLAGSQFLSHCVCDVCNKQMLSLKALHRHKRTYHLDGSRCRYCKQKFSNRPQLKHHTRVRHPAKYNEFMLNGQTNLVVELKPIESIPECSTCGTMVYGREALHRHHADCDKTCLECGVKTTRRDYYFAHLEKEHGIKIDEFLCPFGCSESFHSEKVLQNHIQRVHPDDEDENEDAESTSTNPTIFPCSQCHMRFQSQRSLTQHTTLKHKVSTTPEILKTRNAPKFTREEFVDKFMVRKSADYYRCVPCKKDFHRRSIGLHLRGKHAAVKLYRCEVCPEAFFRQDYRQRHMLQMHSTHFRCSKCDVQFDRAYKIDAHNKENHGIPVKNLKPEDGTDLYDLSSERLKYIEDQSTYDFSKDDMKRRPSILSTSSASNVEVPMTKDEFVEKYMININDKSMQCTVCQQKMMKSSMISHLLWKHAQKKPLKCSFCNERVVKNMARIAHMARAHPNEYKCSECRAQFVKHEGLVFHMREEHGKTVTSKASRGEEDDLSLGDVCFMSNRSEEEVIEEPDNAILEPEVRHDMSHHCPHCDRSFATSRNLQIHKTHKHKGESVVSDVLPEGEMSFEEFRTHYCETVSNTDIKCLVCFKSVRRKNIGNHVKSMHATSGAYLCAICPEAFYRPEHRIQHMSQAHRGTFFCQTCNIQFYRNSRYAKHMKDVHDIEADGNDNYEVDLGLGELKFVATIKPSMDEEQIVKYQEEEPMEAEAEIEEESQDVLDDSKSLSRDEFIEQFIENVNKDVRKCLACATTIMKGSLYNHLMKYHALTLPFKCPFCDLRLERAQYRVRHMQIFHPDEYKCHECGLQYQTHAKYVEHMQVEHNTTNIVGKCPGEEKDLSSYDIRYVAQRSGDDSYWQEDEQVEFIKPEVKLEPPDDNSFIMHSIFNTDDDMNLLEEQQEHQKTPSYGIEYNYMDFKSKFIVDGDAANHRCLPCDRLVLKTSTCAHLRLWHAITMCYNCELCSEGFQRVDYRQRHMKFSHPEDFKCSFCNIQFYRSMSYKNHMIESHNIKVYVQELKNKEEIDVPLENMKFIEHVPDHIRLRGTEGETTTRRGGRPSITPSIEPINPEGGGITFGEFNEQYIENRGSVLWCSICKTSMTKFSIKKHMKRYHATSHAFFCELCPESFQRPDLRMQHMATSHQDNFKCSTCNIQFYMSSTYTEHMKTTHNMQVRVPEMKKKSEIDVPMERLRFLPEKLENEDPKPTPPSSSMISLKRAKLKFLDVPDDIELTREQFYGKFFRSIKKEKSSGEPKTRCLACFKIFSTKNRKFHAMHNHANRRPLKCELCPRKFFLKNKRVWHMNRFHPDDYKCSECFVQFDRAYQYIEHMQQTHQFTVDLPIPDPDEINVPEGLIWYTKKSTAHRDLQKEKRMSGGAAVASVVGEEEPSSEASSFFVTAEDLFKCSECQEEFDSARSLRIHMRNHSEKSAPVVKVEEEKPKTQNLIHQCDICSKKFLALFALNAHKKFKHRIEPLSATGSSGKKKKCDKEKPKYEVDCDICEFTSHRRDYVEHHVRTAHKSEFQCRYCSRVISNFNHFIFHIHENHPKAHASHQLKHKCDECHRSFNLEENLVMHKEKKHDVVRETPQNYCEACCVSYKDDLAYRVHNENHNHKSMQKFVEEFLLGGRLRDNGDEVYELSNDTQESTIPQETTVDDILITDEENDPFQRMLEQRRDAVEPLEKRIKLTNDEDKLEYLKYLQIQNGLYKCGICGKQKTVRKYMLHHLKQHSEVPTYSCDRCPEKFVFRKKYEKHLLLHEQEANVEQHPKYQDTATATVKSNEIKCEICQIGFKLTIMLNRHNTTWHAADNPDKALSMAEQKSKKEVGIIKLLRCKHCLEAFIKPHELKEHLRVKHNSESIDQESDETAPTEEVKGKGAFPCDKCKFSFEEKKFLENHQKYFCIHRQLKTEVEIGGKLVINEQ